MYLNKKQLFRYENCKTIFILTEFNQQYTHNVTDVAPNQVFRGLVYGMAKTVKP